MALAVQKCGSFLFIETLLHISEISEFVTLSQVGLTWGVCS